MRKDGLCSLIFLMCFCVFGYFVTRDILEVLQTVLMAGTLAVIVTVPIWFLVFITVSIGTGFKEAWKEFNPIALIREFKNV